MDKETADLLTTFIYFLIQNEEGSNGMIRKLIDTIVEKIIHKSSISIQDN